jgi:hypothetical protein
MYRRFTFEGSVHDTLETVPLAVQRKLDLAGIRISIFGWRALPREYRLSLCHLPVETAEDVAVYREVLMRFTARTGIPVEPLPGAPCNRRSWSLPEVLSRLDAQLGPEATRGLDARRLASLSDEERYALFSLADPARDPARLRTALLEVGLGEGASPTVRCSRPTPACRR